MLVSMNRTVVDLVTAKPVGRAELADLGLYRLLQPLQPRELFLPPGQPLEIRDDQRAHRGIALRCGDPGVAVHVVGHGDRNVLHSFTVTRLMWSAPAVASPRQATAPAQRGPYGREPRRPASGREQRVELGEGAEPALAGHVFHLRGEGALPEQEPRL